MLKNYIKIAWRNLVKGKLYSIINITGLAVGITCCILIGLFVYEELRFDRFHEKTDRIYRVNYILSNEHQTITSAKSPPPLAQYLEERYPEVEKVVSVNKTDGIVRVKNELFEEDFFVTSAAFFDLFDFEAVRGDPAESMASPNEVLLTQEAAAQLYGDTNAIGKPIELRIDNKFYQVTVSGIIENPPSYSSIQFRVLVPQIFWTKANPESANLNNWGTLHGVRYALLNEQADVKSLSKKVTSDIKEELDGRFTTGRVIQFQPLTGIHFGDNVQWGLEPTANAAFIYIAVLIAGLILVIACINFTSLSMGQSVRRAREVGMRKTMGADRRQLIAQFWGETLLVVVFSLFVGLLLAELLLPYFSLLVNRSLELNLVENSELFSLIIGVILLTGLLAGSYPALYLSNFNPQEVLRSKIHIAGNHSLIRILTGIQFTLTITLIIGTLFMNQQMQLLLDSNLGFDEEYVIQIDVPFEEGRSIMERLQTRLGSEPAVRAISGSWNGLAGAGSGFIENPINSQDEQIRGFYFGMDPELPELLDLNLIEGRFFREGTNLNSPQEVLVNEALTRALGWEDPIGKSLSGRFNIRDATVIGVVEDFHFQSMHNPIAPLVIFPSNYVLSLYARVQGNNLQQALDKIEASWQAAAQGIPFNFTFLDDQIEQQYQADQRWARIVELASGIVIVISCMGLFGLAALASVKRAKEIAVRKIVGATAAGIAATLSKDFLKPVAVGLAIAIPLAHLLMSRWLADFAYRIEMGVDTYLGAVVITLLIAMVTVSWHSVRAALANPVDNLRNV